MPESPRLPWRIVALSTVVAFAAAGTTYVILDHRTAPASPGSVDLTHEKDLPSVEDVSFTTFAGEQVPLSSLKGTPTVINFFASTCAPCVREMPAFEQVHKDIGGSELAFLGLAVTDRSEDALALVARTGVTYPTAQDRDGAVINALGGVVLPTTVLLDADGEVVAAHAGELDAKGLRALLADELGIEA